MELNKDKSSDERVFNDTEDNLSLILQNLFKKTGYDIEDGKLHGKRVRFHCMRKFLSERLSVHSSESQWKQIVGKAVGEGAYISQDQLRAVYLKAMKDISINGNGNGIKAKRLIEIENSLVESQKRLTAVETTNDVLRMKLQELDTFVHKLPVKGEAVVDPQKKRELLELLNRWRIRSDSEAEEYTEKQRDIALGSEKPMTPTEEAEVKKHLEEYRKQQREKP